MEQEGFLLQEEKEFKRFYKLSTWWVVHRALLKKIIYAIFIVVDSLLLIYAGWHLLDAFAISYDAEERAVAEMVAFGQVDLHAYTVANAADELVADDVRVFSIGDDQYDFYTTIYNPNGDWWAEFTYFFESDAGQTESQKGFILPAQEKSLVSFALDSEITPRSGEVVIENLNWNRIDHHFTGDYKMWEADRLEIEIEDAKYSKQTGFEDEVYGRTTFTVTNDSAFSYYDPAFFILLKKGSSIVGVNRTTLSKFETGEEADIGVNWFGTLPSVTSVEVEVELNIFDKDVYKDLEGGTSIDVRT